MFFFLIALGVVTSFNRFQTIEKDLPWYAMADNNAELVADSMAMNQGIRPRLVLHPGFGQRYLLASFFKLLNIFDGFKYNTLKSIQDDPIKYYPEVYEKTRLFSYLLTTVSIGLALALIAMTLTHNPLFSGFSFIAWSLFSGTEVQCHMIRSEPTAVLFSLFSVLFIILGINSKNIFKKYGYLIVSGIMGGMAYYTKIHALPFLLIGLALLVVGKEILNFRSEDVVEEKKRLTRKTWQGILEQVFVLATFSIFLKVVYKFEFLSMLGVAILLGIILNLPAIWKRSSKNEKSYRILEFTQKKIVLISYYILGFILFIRIMYSSLRLFINKGDAKLYYHDLLNAGSSLSYNLKTFGTNKEIAPLIKKTLLWFNDIFFTPYLLFIVVAMFFFVLVVKGRKKIVYALPLILVLCTYLYQLSVGYRSLSDIYLVFPSAIFVIFLAVTSHLSFEYLRILPKISTSKTARAFVLVLICTTLVLPVTTPQYTAKRKQKNQDLGKGTDKNNLSQLNPKYQFENRDILRHYDNYYNVKFFKDMMKTAYPTQAIFLDKALYYKKNP